LTFFIFYSILVRDRQKGDKPMKARYQIAITLTVEEYAELKLLRIKKWTNIDIFRYGLNGITKMILKAKNLAKE